MAESLSMGRSTSVHVWICPEGKLYLSFCVLQNEPKYLSNDLITVLLLICSNTCPKEILKPLPGFLPDCIGVRWPSAIIYDYEKLSGELSESSGDYYVIEISINVEVNPIGTDSRGEATSLKRLAKNLSANKTTPQEFLKLTWACLFKIFTD
ncbi:unnamed protein product [Phytomonas sp. EM1]|nr:unnamed protein product [Phytomonas sp. EM1]|eukprot:CCW65793.1 unnamed protein product [Phytomonas sp. isolate EM1]